MGCVVAMAANSSPPLTGIVFEPFKELQTELDLVPQAADLSLARQKYVDDCEAAINEQIKWVKFDYFLFKDGFFFCVYLMWVCLRF